MADDALAGSKDLKSTFGKAAKHMFSATMVFMMVSMALPALGAIADPTLVDTGLALVDHYKTMFTAPFTEMDTIGKIASNTAEGNFSSSYVLGSGHAGHGAIDAIAHGSGEHAASEGITHGTAHVAPSSPYTQHFADGFNEWHSELMQSDALSIITEDCGGDMLGCYKSEYYMGPGHH